MSREWINWRKTHAIYSPYPLPGSLAHVCVSQVGEVEKYLGMLHGPSAEDLEIGPQLISKLRKKCAELQSPFLTLAARVAIVNSILLGQLWFYLAVWVPQMQRQSRSSKSSDLSSGGVPLITRARVAMLPGKRSLDGGLGVIDPILKAKVFHG